MELDAADLLIAVAGPGPRRRCQAIASPSRSGSVARKTAVLPRASSFRRLTTSLRSLGTTYCGSKLVFDVDAELAGRQVADMAHAGADDVVAPQKFLDCFGLGGRFDHHQALLWPLLWVVLSLSAELARSLSRNCSGPGIQHCTDLACQSSQFEHGQCRRNLAGTDVQRPGELVNVARFATQRLPHRRLLGRRVRARGVPRSARCSRRSARSTFRTSRMSSARRHRCGALLEQLVRCRRSSG